MTDSAALLELRADIVREQAALPPDAWAPDGVFCWCCGRRGAQPYGEVKIMTCGVCDVIWYAGVAEHPARGWVAADPEGEPYIDHGAVHAPSPA